MVKIGGRNVKVCTGSKSQTVNIRTLDNTDGEYDYIIRLHAPSYTSERELERNNFSTIQQLIDFLVKKYHAKIERSLLSETAIPELISNSTLEEKDIEEFSSDWVIQSKDLVEKSIDQLVNEFIEYPYLHRVEHSLHCQLFNILTQHELFKKKYPILDWTFQPVQKEWPEWKPRPEKKNQRGNFDISIIDPSVITNIKDFKNGRFKPPIAIELGLDYGLDHLKKDAEKLINSKIQHPYLVHFIREDFRLDNYQQVEEFIKQSKIPIAYACISNDSVRYKTLNLKTIVTLSK